MMRQEIEPDLRQEGIAKELRLFRGSPDIGDPQAADFVAFMDDTVEIGGGRPPAPVGGGGGVGGRGGEPACAS